MEVSYATMIAIGTLVQRLGRDASRYQAALAEAVNESAEWKRIADELKAERNALRSTTIDTAAGHLLDAFGSLAHEPRHGATDDAYRDRIVTKIHTIKLERDALRAQLDTERERHKQTASILAQYAPKTMQIEPPPEATHDTPEGKQAAESVIRYDRKTAPDEIKVGDVVRATFWKAGQAAVVKEILADGRLMLDCSDQPWRVDEVVKLMRKVTT